MELSGIFSVVAGVLAYFLIQSLTNMGSWEAIGAGLARIRGNGAQGAPINLIQLDQSADAILQRQGEQQGDARHMSDDELRALIPQGETFLSIMESGRPLRFHLGRSDLEQLQGFLRDQDALAQAIQQAINLLRDRIVVPKEAMQAASQEHAPQIQQFVQELVNRKVLLIGHGEDDQAFLFMDLRGFQAFMEYLLSSISITGRVEELSDDDGKPDPVPIIMGSESESDDEIIVEVAPAVKTVSEEPVVAAEEVSQAKLKSSASMNTVSAALLICIGFAML